MRPANQWTSELLGDARNDDAVISEGRDGAPTLRVGNVYLHSRYNPRDEAKRFVESLELSTDRPVVVIGLGLGYHVLELVAQGMDVSVIEPDAAVARLALEGPMRGSTVMLGIGTPDRLAEDDGFRLLAQKNPQWVIHPPTARIHPKYPEIVIGRLALLALQGERLSIAIVGPMYGGSLPIALYLQRAFEKLGHRTLFVDNSTGWDLYSGIAASVSNKNVSDQLGAMATNLLGEWSYARVMEFVPDICIVLAQAPVPSNFAERLRKEGIVTAFWFVENWRHFSYWSQVAPQYDYFFHLQPGEFEDKLREVGCAHQAFVQTACDPEIHRPIELTADERKEVSCDISFAGAGYRNRVRLFSGLTDYDFKIWGVNWVTRDLVKHICRAEERFTPDFFARIAAGSRININLHSSILHDGVDPKCDTINPRVFEIAACGAFQLCDPCIGLDRLFAFETEIPVYTSLAELRQKIDYYLAHPAERAEIAKRARAHALREHTYEHRARQMLECILADFSATILRKGVRVQRTVSEMADRVGRETELGTYLGELSPSRLFLFEEIYRDFPPQTELKSYPEKLFAYLREMRMSNEALLRGK